MPEKVIFFHFLISFIFFFLLTLCPYHLKEIRPLVKVFFTSLEALYFLVTTTYAFHSHKVRIVNLDWIVWTYSRKYFRSQRPRASCESFHKEQSCQAKLKTELRRSWLCKPSTPVRRILYIMPVYQYDLIHLKSSLEWSAKIPPEKRQLIENEQKHISTDICS